MIHMTHTEERLVRLPSGNLQRTFVAVCRCGEVTKHRNSRGRARNDGDAHLEAAHRAAQEKQ